MKNKRFMIKCLYKNIMERWWLMLEEEVYKKIMNQVIINKEQGYALLF